MLETGVAGWPRRGGSRRSPLPAHDQLSEGQAARTRRARARVKRSRGKRRGGRSGLFVLRSSRASPQTENQIPVFYFIWLCSCVVLCLTVSLQCHLPSSSHQFPSRTITQTVSVLGLMAWYAEAEIHRCSSSLQRPRCCCSRANLPRNVRPRSSCCCAQWVSFRWSCTTRSISRAKRACKVPQLGVDHRESPQDCTSQIIRLQQHSVSTVVVVPSRRILLVPQHDKWFK